MEPNDEGKIRDQWEWDTTLLLTVGGVGVLGAVAILACFLFALIAAPR